MRRLMLGVMFVVLMGAGFTVYAKSAELQEDFESTKIGNIPEGWVAGATRGNVKDLNWKVVEDKTSKFGSHVLGLESVKTVKDGRFNLCWTNKIKFKDGEISVFFKSMKGRVDEGGGIMWRVKDNNNYYVVRFNPLEDNFRLYYVKNSHRHMLASAKAHLKKGEWHSMKVIIKGDHFQAFLNGKKMLDIHDKIFKNSGGVGLWTKSDAQTRFDHFVVKPE